MHESWSIIPRVTNFDDADITELEEKREASKEDYARSGIKLTNMPFLMKAIALALKKHPLVNASYDDEHGFVIYKDYVNLGIAVDTERGLVVPVVRAVDKLSVPEIARCWPRWCKKCGPASSASRTCAAGRSRSATSAPSAGPIRRRSSIIPRWRSCLPAGSENAGRDR